MGHTPLHMLKVKPANYRSPLAMLSAAEAVPEDGGRPATYVQVQRIAGLFWLNANRFGNLADSVGLTEAQADAILARGRSGLALADELAANVPGRALTC